MKIGDMSISSGKLRLAVDALRNAWLEASEMWNDPAARRFEAEVLDPLAPVVKTALESMGRLAMVFAEAERALEQ